MKAAFDNVDILWTELRKKGIKEMLIRRLERIYEQTEEVIRTNQGYTERTKKGVQQGCMMNPLLFNLCGGYRGKKKQRDKKRIKR